jgi:hypothetical protein
MLLLNHRHAVLLAEPALDAWMCAVLCRYLMVSSQYYRPVPEPFEGRYKADTMGFVVLVQHAEYQIPATLAVVAQASHQAASTGAAHGIGGAPIAVRASSKPSAVVSSAVVNSKSPIKVPK